MKTKTKMKVIVEIAIVLCSVFLVALPAIATEQNQAMQKVSASEVTTASEDDHVLDIYGNANEDDTIDMGDVVYTKLAIFGKKPKTELCDAKYDGRINVLDVIQTKLIILGKEKELTVVDYYGDAVSIRKPVESIVVMHDEVAEVLRAIGAEDKIVAVDTSITGKETFYPKLGKLPSIGQWGKPDYEAILTLNPDLVIWVSMGMRTSPPKEKLPDIPILTLDLRTGLVGDPPDTKYFTNRVRVLGAVVDKKEASENLIDWYCGEINKIKSQTSELSEDEKPRVLTLDHFKVGGGYYVRVDRVKYASVIAGASNICLDRKGEVDPEWVMTINPDIIVILVGRASAGYETDDPSDFVAAREDILSRLELAEVTAVKDKRVYVSSHGAALIFNGPSTPIGVAHMAKWFHPDLFDDLDPEAIHQEYLERFHEDLNFNVKEHGVFAYPSFTHPVEE